MKSCNSLWHNPKFELWGINVLGIILQVFLKKISIKEDSRVLSKIVLKPPVEK